MLCALIFVAQGKEIDGSASTGWAQACVRRLLLLPNKPIFLVFEENIEGREGTIDLRDVLL